MSSHLTRLSLLVVLCSVAAGCHTTSFGKSIGYLVPTKSDLGLTRLVADGCRADVLGDGKGKCT
jgi:hypothetical protein